MKTRITIASASASACAMLVYLLCDPLTQLPKFYSESLRTGLFSGFLTLGGFLFSLKTFTVIKMKESVYDTPEYRQNLHDANLINGTPNAAINIYGPLRQLSSLLFLSILLSFLTAVLQLTLGLVPHWLASLTCVTIASFTIALFICSVIEIQRNLTGWFERIELCAKKQYSKEHPAK